MDRKEEIIKLQMDVINQMTQNNLRRIADDLWGLPTLQSGGTPAVKEPSAAAPPAPADADAADAGQASAAQPKARKSQETEAPPEPIENLKKELEDYIGLSVIKKEVQSLINLVTVQKLRRQNDLPVEDLSLHMVFSGNPGTGKTMIARLMSRIYRSLGILSKGQLVEVDRGGLVAGYVGQTALKTGEAIAKALGGVLFVDEAYALTDHGENDYGQEAVDTLLKAMEDHRDDLVVIVAGYTELMETFVHSNPGLESRFNRFMHFPDYTVEEMLAIFDMRCEKSGYRLSPDARDLLKGLLALLSLDVKGFGNARGVRNLFERAVSAQADRLASLPEINRDTLMLLTSDDLRVAAGEEKAAEKQARAEAGAKDAPGANAPKADPSVPEDAPDEPSRTAVPPQPVSTAEDEEDQPPEEGASTVEQLFRHAKSDRP
ncbi:MAG: AAA family ATPase [Clostridiales bacterium]|nr:AAA family ATPase [Clostridiales bacterium]